ncbi:hypothetical protein MBELCI_2838 [Limimaricola cinnabarinus LL-001]|uniref:Uncharacterized protein n=1 Tax=Limimaricola cinnabarinus LL-001 TaxID=1337093 RepID=U2YNC8_9RHOB|nr:hypothetical protein MBELCI_2838 [Limimaricola cinnabarinus LL-001]
MSGKGGPIGLPFSHAALARGTATQMARGRNAPLARRVVCGESGARC